MRKELAKIPKTRGQKRLYETPEELESAIAKYTDHVKKTKEPVTINGLTLFLGFSSKSALDEYMKIDGFKDIVMKARTFVEYNYEMLLHGGKPTGAIFALKNMGWSDKTVVDNVSSDGSMTPSRTTLDDFYAANPKS